MEFLLQAVLIALNAVFACAEIAVISMNDAKLAKLTKQGDKRAVRLASLTSQPARFLATIQVAITLSGFLGSAFAADNFSDRLVSFILGLGVNIPYATLDSIAVVLITLILSYFTLVLGELVPKRLAMRNAEKLALSMAGMLRFVSRLFAPLVWLLTASTNGILRLLGADPHAQDEKVTEEEIRMMVDVGGENGSIAPTEQAFIHNVFEFDDLTAEELCTHRTKLVLLWEEDSPEEWARVICGSGFSKYPICGKNADDIKGVLDAKIYFRLTEKTKEQIYGKAVQEVWFVPDKVKADDLFHEMKQKGKSFAVVLDDHGGVQGVVTLHDLVRRLVGGLETEETRRQTVRQLAPGMFEIAGETPLDEVAHALEITLEKGEYDTFGGYVFDKLGYIPPDGVTFTLETDGLYIQAAQVQGHRLKCAVAAKAETEKAAVTQAT